MFSLDGKFAVVSGALGNLGPVWVGALRDAGAEVFGFDIQPGADGQADATDEHDLGELTRSMERPPDIVIANAGIDAPPLSILNEDAMLWTNYWSVVQTFRTFAVQGQRCSFVAIGSLYTVVAPDKRLYVASFPPDDLSKGGWNKPHTYAASKAAVLSWCRQMAAQWADRGVRINMLSPGGVLGNQDPEFVRRYSERTPMGRMATPEDLVGPLLFLASDASRYMTGQNLVVDGGYSAW